MEIQIRKLEDSNIALDIARSNPDFFNKHGLEMMEESFKSDSLFGAFADDQVIGFSSFKELNDQVIELTWMAVRPSFQNKSVGKKLILDGLNQLPKKYKICEVKTLSEIDSDPGYVKTRGFYKHLGFIPLETINPYPAWGDNDPCQIFIKILD